MKKTLSAFQVFTGLEFFRCTSPGAPGCRTLLAFFTPGSFISTILPNILLGAGIIFFILIIVFGFGIIGAAGKESSPQDKAKAQAALTYAVFGFLLVVSAYFILQIIETITGIKFLAPTI